MFLPGTRLSRICQYCARQLQRTWTCTKAKATAAKESKHKIKALSSIQTCMVGFTNQNGDSQILVPVCPLTQCSVPGCVPPLGPPHLTLRPICSPYHTVPTAMRGVSSIHPRALQPFWDVMLKGFEPFAAQWERAQGLMHPL